MDSRHDGQRADADYLGQPLKPTSCSRALSGARFLLPGVNQGGRLEAWTPPKSFSFSECSSAWPM